MKSIKHTVLLIMGMIAFSCDDFLSPLPNTSNTTESFFSSDEEVKQGINGIYDAVQGVNENTNTNDMEVNRGVQYEYLLTEHRTDNTRSATLEGSRADFHRYLVDPNNVQSEDYYASMYEVIFRANNMLNYVDVADEANREKYTAEAKFLRAYAYFNLVRLYGAVPLVTAPVVAEDKEALFTRVAVETVYFRIVEDLQEAATNLDNSSRNRASKAAAQGLLAKVYLSQPSPNYAGAQEMCKAIIDGGGYSLMPKFYDVFYSELNAEIIFAIQYLSGNAEESQGFSAEFTSAVRAGRQDGLNILNQNLIDDFVAHGGNRSSVSYTTIGTSNEVAKFLPDGYGVADEYGPNSRNAGNDWVVLRYADVLLMHVEAIMAGGGSTSNAEALASFNKVRGRAGLDAVTNISKGDLLTERRVELAFENQRWFDLIRFGVVDQVLSAHAVEMGYADYSARSLLLPIPAREINLSGGLLKQNPGY